jgi:hypothetical protein
MLEYQRDMFLRSDFSTATELRAFFESNRERIVGQRILGIFACGTSIAFERRIGLQHMTDTPIIVLLENYELVLETMLYSRINIRINKRKDSLTKYAAKYLSICTGWRRHNINAVGRGITSFNIEAFSNAYYLSGLRRCRCRDLYHIQRHEDSEFKQQWTKGGCCLKDFKKNSNYDSI